MVTVARGTLVAINLRPGHEILCIDLNRRSRNQLPMDARIERRTDLLLSTMRGYVEALGGKLELRAVFPDGEFLLDTLGPEKRTRSSTTARAKR